eukprot:scaffold897_cov402-Prasinococcus_capsulatus_cf.AAC.52
MSNPRRRLGLFPPPCPAGGSQPAAELLERGPLAGGGAVPRGKPPGVGAHMSARSARGGALVEAEPGPHALLAPSRARPRAWRHGVVEDQQGRLALSVRALSRATHAARRLRSIVYAIPRGSRWTEPLAPSSEEADKQQ